MSQKTLLNGKRIRLKNRRVAYLSRPDGGIMLVFRSLQYGRKVTPTAFCRMHRHGKKTMVEAILSLSDEAVLALGTLCADYLRGKPKYTLAS